MKNLDLLKKFVKEEMSKKTDSTCEQLETVVSSLEALEVNEHDAAYEIIHTEMTALKDKLFQEIFIDFVKHLLDDAEETRQEALKASQVLNAAYDDSL